MSRVESTYRIATILRFSGVLAVRGCPDRVASSQPFGTRESNENSVLILFTLRVTGCYPFFFFLSTCFLTKKSIKQMNRTLLLILTLFTITYNYKT